VVGEPEVVDVLDLLAAAVEAGVDLPRALRAVGEVLTGPLGPALAQTATALLWGAPWSEAWAAAPDDLRRAIAPLERSWSTGSAAAPVLREAAAGVRRRRRRAGREAAGRLGVTVMLPLGLCFLPAFVLVGLVPVLISLAGRAFG
jgi:pilus assembly protein TadC